MAARDPGRQQADSRRLHDADDERFVFRMARSRRKRSGDQWRLPCQLPEHLAALAALGQYLTGYGGYDGQVWTQLGSGTISMPAQIYFGFAVSSRSASTVATAQFVTFSNVSNAVVGVAINPHEAIGPSSRKSPVAFSEIMWKPAARTDGKNLEFVELYNSNPWFQDISGYQITCADVNYNISLRTPRFPAAVI